MKAVLKKLYHALWPALTGMLLALGLVLPALRALNLACYGAAVFASAVTAVFLTFIGARGVCALAGGACGALTLALAVLTGNTLPRLGGMLGAMFALVNGSAAALQMYAPEVAAVLSVLLTLVGWSLALGPGGFLPAFSLELIAVLACWVAGLREEFYLFAPGLVALMALLSCFTHEGASKPATLATSAVAVLAALALTPVISHTSPALSNLAENIRTFITDTFFFTETRTVYSIEVDGYMPLETRLGGPVVPNENPVMQVETQNAILLRGSIHNNYTGLSWRNTLSSRRYRYSTVRYDAQRGEATDTLTPAQALQLSSDLFTAYPVSISMNANSASTLFSMLRMQNLTTPMALVPYFNTSSEIFITRDLAPGDAYSFSAPIITSEDSRLDALVSSAAQGAAKKDMSAYLQLPNAIADDVYTLVERIVANCETPLEKARAIRTYLYYNMAYTLSPEAPPDNQDFVSYFLLRGKEGYCTYFASAMAVLGRIAGLPTRYVEGYLVQPSGGVALVTGKDAHAWAEVWFDGFGWVSFDATPPHGTGGSSSAQTPPQGGDSPDDAPDDSPEQNPNPSQSGGDASQDQSPDTQSDLPDSPDTPDSQDPADSPDAETPPPDSPRSSRSNWWLWLLLLLALAALVVRVWWTLPAQAVKRLTRPDQQLLLWYRALLGLLAAAGLGAKPSESPTAHALRVAKRLPKDCGFLDVADSLTMLGYGRFGASPAQVEHAARCYRALATALPLKARLVWFVRRTAKGLGGVEQVP